MPISREEFEAGQIDLTIFLTEIFSVDILLAWNLDELIGALQRRLGIEVQQDVVLPSLRALELGGKIEHRVIWGRDYWILKMD